MQLILEINVHFSRKNVTGVNIKALNESLHNSESSDAAEKINAIVRLTQNVVTPWM